MRIVVYARVSAQRQAQMQTIDQQLERLQAHVQFHGWEWRDDWVIRSDGYSGARRVSTGNATRRLLTAHPTSRR